MKLDWMMLTNHAEAPPAIGLIYISGGAWDTVTIPEPPERPVDGAVAVLVGVLAIRLLFRVDECGQEHTFRVTFTSEDGDGVAEVGGTIAPERVQDAPKAWDTGVNLTLPLTGLPIPRFGIYRIGIEVGGNPLGTTDFRVLKGY